MGIPTPHEVGTENTGIETYIDSFGRENIQIGNVVLINSKIIPPYNYVLQYVDIILI